MSEDLLINGRYKVVSELGRGGYGQVLKVEDTQKHSLRAMKLSIRSNSSLQDEYKALKDLQGGEGIPKIYSSGRHKSSFFIVMQLLEDNLYSLSKANKLSLDMITLILIQCISRIEYVHSKNYIHRDIKPQQFVLGSKDSVFLIDFGISKRYFINNNHISFQSNCPCIGSCHFASINSHVGLRLSRRDDLESLIYSSVYMIKKTLPWLKDFQVDQHLKWNYILRLKRESESTELFTDCPRQIQDMYKYIRSLKFEEKPDYDYLRNLLKTARIELGFTQDLNLNIRGKIVEERKTAPVIEKKNNELELKEALKRSKTLNQRVNNKNLLCPHYFEKQAVSNGSTNVYTNMDETEKNSFPEFSKILRFQLRRGKTNYWVFSKLGGLCCI
jgi:serine/threonine protein kinase